MTFTLTAHAWTLKRMIKTEGIQMKKSDISGLGKYVYIFIFRNIVK